MCVYVRTGVGVGVKGYVHVSASASAWKLEVWGSQKLELGAVVRQPKWVLGVKLQSPE